MYFFSRAIKFFYNQLISKKHMSHVTFAHENVNFFFLVFYYFYYIETYTNCICVINLRLYV